MGSIMKNGIAYGGGGTDVVANPSGTATDTLEKLKVGSTIYDLAGGGSHIVQPPVVDQSVTYTYNRTEQTLQFTTLDTNNTVVTNNKKTDAGTYTCTVSLKGRDDVWADTLGQGDRTFQWTINPKTVTIPTVTSTSKTYDGSEQSPTISLFDENEIALSGTYKAINAGDYTLTMSLTSVTNYVWNDTTVSPIDVAWSIAKAASSITLNKNSLVLNSTTLSDTVSIIATTGDGALSVASSDTSVATVTENSGVYIISSVNNTTGTANIEFTLAETANWASTTTTVSVSCEFVTIWGVQWDGTSTSAWSRTDAAQNYTDPSPAVNNGDGSSPFDSFMPWSGMTRVEDAEAGTLVRIPKFWYKWTRSGSTMKLQIANGPVEGFSVSPAHQAKNSNETDRDYVYVAAYHCSSSNYKSTTGVAPKANITRATARSGISALGTTIWQWDYAMLWTIEMLYLVEYADWNSQEKIGYGCGNNSAAENAGLTDAMTYHTGTNAANRTTYGHTRYRYIEDLWGNVYDWCDGIYFSSSTIYAIKNPANFSDTSGGTNVGTRPTSSVNVVYTWTAPTATGLEYYLYPASGGSDSTYSTYSCDSCYYNSSGVVLYVGGGYGQVQYFGLFYRVGYYAASGADAGIGCRLQKLP